MKIESKSEPISINEDGIIHLPEDCVKALRLDPEDHWSIQWGPTANIIMLNRLTVSCAVCGIESNKLNGLTQYGKSHFCSDCLIHIGETMANIDTGKYMSGAK